MSLGKRIAIADDDEQIRLLVGSTLQLAGYQCDLYDSGMDLLDGVRVNLPDLVLLDISMPVMDGMTTFNKLKEIKEDIPVIFLTGNEDKKTILKCIAMGADGYILKPVDNRMVITKIKEVLIKREKYVSNKIILMVDDDASFLKIAKTKLSKYFKVLTVNSGKTAIDYLSAHKVDLIILDYFMPLYDGNSVLTMLKKRSSTSKIPVIISSILTEAEVYAACVSNPPDGVVSKPVNMDDLLNLIENLLTTTHE